MDVLITLPEKYITAILKGYKIYEMRKSIPMRLSYMDRVYVVEKGSNMVRLSFKCKTFYRLLVKEVDDFFLIKNVNITTAELKIYAGKRQSLYFWLIENPRVESLTIQQLNVRKNPQSYIYINP